MRKLKECGKWHCRKENAKWTESFEGGSYEGGGGGGFEENGRHHHDNLHCSRLFSVYFVGRIEG